ncbi:MAG: zf-HC2 domain-containing protein [Capsulimonas sp.]|uniref:anti-sigma factor family protein n=1 Tax=Capsulimonas sp. TaxID=2494211 RepID=UPI003263D59B
MSNPCKNFRPMISEHSDGLLPPAQSSQVESHLAECASCRTFAQEMKVISQGVAALPRRQTSAAFDTVLAARLAEAQRVAAAKPAWRRALDNLFFTPQQALRPGLAVCGVAAAMGVAVFFSPHIAPPAITPPQAQTDDGAMVAQCIEQHRSDVSAQPLDDWSAQNLSQQFDSKAPAAPSAVSLSEEANF